eukprot:1879156-Prorocentrum_lima.AAC.1
MAGFGATSPKAPFASVGQGVGYLRLDVLSIIKEKVPSMGSSGSPWGPQRSWCSFVVSGLRSLVVRMALRKMRYRCHRASTS